MNFTRLVKEELTQYPVKINEMLAEMLAYLSFNGQYDETSDTIIFQTKIPMVALRFVKIFKSLYPKLEKEVITNKNKTGSAIKVVIKQNAKQILSEINFTNSWNENNDLLIQNSEDKKAFLRGAFLVKGSINSPETSEYHMEIYSKTKETVTFMQSLFNAFYLNAKIIKRRSGYIVYLKEAEKISDFLKLVGAQNNLFLFEDYRIKRDAANATNRIYNCDMYDMNKIINNAVKQLKYIDILEKNNKLTSLPQSLLEVISLRKEFQNASLNELVELYKNKYKKNISKSGIYHRFEKIKRIVKGEDDYE